jgi:acyl-CoA thioesterase
MIAPEYFDKDRFAKDNGVRVVSAGDGMATAAFDVDDRHRNAHGSVHGGMIFTLADVAFCYACMSKGGMAVSLQTSINFTAPVMRGTVTAIARELSRSKRVGVYDVRVTGADGVLLAAMTGTAYIKEV